MSQPIGNLAVILSANSAPLAAGLAQAKVQIAQFQAQAAQARASMAGNKGSDPLGGLGGMIAGRIGPMALAAGAFAAATAGAAAFARKMVTVAAENESAAVSFKTLTGDARSAGKLMADLQDFAKRNALGDMDELRKSAISLMGAGVPMGSILPVMQGIGNVSAATGADLGQLTLAFKQVYASGRLMTEELNQFGEAGFPIEEFAKSLKVPLADLRKLTSEGKVSADVMVKTFNRLSFGGGRFANAMSDQANTLKGQWQSLNLEMEQSAGRMGKMALPQTKNLVANAGNLVERAIAGGMAAGGMLSSVMNGSKMGRGFLKLYGNDPIIKGLFGDNKPAAPPSKAIDKIPETGFFRMLKSGVGLIGQAVDDPSLLRLPTLAARLSDFAKGVNEAAATPLPELTKRFADFAKMTDFAKSMREAGGQSPVKELAQFNDLADLTNQSARAGLLADAQAQWGAAFALSDQFKVLAERFTQKAEHTLSPAMLKGSQEAESFINRARANEGGESIQEQVKRVMEAALREQKMIQQNTRDTARALQDLGIVKLGP